MPQPYSSALSRRATPQSEAALPNQVPNNAGGFVFEVNNWTALDRFLLLGTEGGTYYTSPRTHTLAATDRVRAAIEEDPSRAIGMIADTSDRGRAPKNDHAIAALAIAASNPSPSTRALALDRLPIVCRTGSHLLMFVKIINEMRGWSSGLRKAIDRWLHTTPNLALQVGKYQAREGMSFRDVLRLAHPKPKDPATAATFRWIVEKEGIASERIVSMGRKGERTYPALDPADLPAILRAMDDAHAGRLSMVEAVAAGLTREMVPSAWLRDPAWWRLSLPSLPLTAMIRNLANMTRIGVITPLGAEERLIIDRLDNRGALQAARIHPISLLIALKTYQSGSGDRGSNTWTPSQSIVAALERAFYASFASIPISDQSTMIALDISGSMCAPVSGINSLSCHEAAAAMAMTVVRSCPHHAIVGFSHQLIPLAINASMSLKEVVRELNRHPFGATDCALPAIVAKRENLEVDQIVIFTDNETWMGSVHPFQALKALRAHLNRPVRQIVVGMTATQFSIADPSDALSLDIAGFDAALPEIINNFGRVR